MKGPGPSSFTPIGIASSLAAEYLSRRRGGSIPVDILGRT